jgi:nucleobase transporter 1/2
MPLPADLANVICTIFFVSGLITLLQTVVGDRLPIIQGGSFAYINPVLAIAGQIKATRTFDSDQDRFLVSSAAVPRRNTAGRLVGCFARRMSFDQAGHCWRHLFVRAPEPPPSISKTQQHLREDS